MFDGNLNINTKTLKAFQSFLLLLDSKRRIVLTNANFFKILDRNFVESFQKKIPKTKPYILANKNNQILSFPNRKRKILGKPKQSTTFPEIPS